VNWSAGRREQTWYWLTSSCWQVSLTRQSSPRRQYTARPHTDTHTLTVYLYVPTIHCAESALWGKCVRPSWSLWVTYTCTCSVCVCQCVSRHIDWRVWVRAESTQLIETSECRVDRCQRIWRAYWAWCSLTVDGLNISRFSRPSLPTHPLHTLMTLTCTYATLSRHTHAHVTLSWHTHVHPHHTTYYTLTSSRLFTSMIIYIRKVQKCKHEWDRQTDRQRHNKVNNWPV